MPEPPCDHDWNTTSNLRLVIRGDDTETMLASIIPTPPRLLPVEFCRQCGTLRLAPEIAQGIAAVERQQVSGGGR